MNNKKKNVSASCVHGNNSICFVAGRSGGHIKPALTLAKEYKETYPESTILFFSTHYELDKKIIQENNEVTVHIPLQLENVPRSLFGVPGYCIRLAWCIIKSLSLLHKYRPSEVISTGGYVSLPVCIAAKLLRIPITLYELNALPGKATRMLAPLAKTIFVPFKKALASFPIDKVQYRSYPLQFHESLTKDQNKARTALHLSNSKKTVFILGGSQGSVSLNNLVKQWIEYETSLATTIQIIHQTGSNDATPWQGLYAQKNITAYVFTFSSSLEHFYQAADIIICRAGAGTLFEALFFKKPCLIIPLETKITDHQVDNARALCHEFPALMYMMHQREIMHNPHLFFETIQKLLKQTPQELK